MARLQGLTPSLLWSNISQFRFLSTDEECVEFVDELVSHAAALPTSTLETYSIGSTGLLITVASEHPESTDNTAQLLLQPTKIPTQPERTNMIDDVTEHKLASSLTLQYDVSKPNFMQIP